MLNHKALVGIVIVGLILCGPVFAATEQDVTLTVTVRELGVSATPGTYAFGVVDAGTTTISQSAIEVENTGNGNEDIGVRIKDEDDQDEWTAAATAAENVYVLSTRLAATAGTFNANDVLTTTVQWCDGTIFAGGGKNMAPSDTVNQWYQFAAPTSVTGVHQSDQHTITVEVSCQQAAP